MIECPKCGAPVDGPWCKVCGEGKGAAVKALADPARYLCHHEDRGQRCGNLGTFSPNIFGDPKGGPHPGPWYCPQHVPGSADPADTKRTPEGARKLAAMLEFLRPSGPDLDAIEERKAIQQEPRDVRT